MFKENNKKILIFPGQGSQYAGMSKELAEKFPKTARVYECGSDILGYDLHDLICGENAEERLTDTQFAQPAIFAASLVSLIAAQESGFAGEYNDSVGHSLGEYAALVSCGALDMENGFKAIKARSAIMSQAGKKNPGGMMAVLGLSSDEINTVCEIIETSDDYIAIANYNSPKQIVIAGTLTGLDKAEELLKQKGAKRLIRLKVSGAFHSELMKEAAEQFKEEINKLTFSSPKVNFYYNFTVDDYTNIAEYLSQQIRSPVMFVTQLQKIWQDGYDTFIEVGPGKVLSGLVNKTLDDVKTLNIDKEIPQ